MKDSVCAVIVTWNTGPELECGLTAISPQVEEIIIVDNGSRPDYVAALEQLSKKFSATLLRNTENLGIAAALNRGVTYAIEKGYDWVLTLDDDSEPQPDMVRKMLEAYYTSTEDQGTIAVIAPNYIALKGLAYKGEEPFFVSTAITSGQLVKAEVFSKVGFYKEDLFIDGVDHEFCLRILKHRFKTMLVPGAVLKQRFGPQPKVHSVFGKKIAVSNHRPERYYYIYRNSVCLYKNYLLTAPLWIFKNALLNAYLLLKVLLFEEDRPKKILMIIRGCLDGIRGKYGKIS